MSSVISVSFKRWIIMNLVFLVSSDIFSQRFVIHDSLSISTNASDVTETESSSVIDCARECKRNTLCHRASYDRLTKRCRIFNEQTTRNCAVGLDVIQTSVFLEKVYDDCNSDWHLFEGHCYFFAVRKLNWTDAQNDCNQKNSYLVTIQNERENNWLADVIKKSDKNGAEFWIGANDKDIEDDWAWESDKSKLLFSDWRVGEPNNARNKEDCGLLKWFNNISLYKWNDGRCNKRKLYICEK